MSEMKMDIVIKVVGVGGGGCNAINDMIAKGGANNVEFIAVNTDIQALEANKASIKILIGGEAGRGLGAGSNPEVGEKCVKESEDEIKKAIKGADMIFIAAGFGGGTGTGAAPEIARIAREMGILTVAVGTKPFNFEGKLRTKKALAGLAKIKNYTDSLIEISNDKVIATSGKRTTFKEACSQVDDILRLGVLGVTELITSSGFINLDFADVHTTFKDSGRAVMGVGQAEKTENSEVNVVLEATKKAINSPLLDTSIDNARRVILHFTSRDDIGMLEIDEASSMIYSQVHEDANIIFGTTIDSNMNEGAVKVTVIATDFDDNNQVKVVDAGSKNEKVAAQQFSAFKLDIPSFKSVNNISRS